MSALTIYRKRLIPAECIALKDDRILHADTEKIVTSWDAFRARENLKRGFSCYLLQEGLKVSKVFHPDESYHWYFDIADYTFDDSGSVLTMTDLLADVYVPQEGDYRVLDLDELADAYAEGLIDAHLLKNSLYTLNRLLRELYRNGIGRFAAPLRDLV